MGRNALNKIKEYRPRLHDMTKTVTRVGPFIILKLDSEAEAKRIENEKFYVRPDKNSGPKCIA